MSRQLWINTTHYTALWLLRGNVDSAAHFDRWISKSCLNMYIDRTCRACTTAKLTGVCLLFSDAIFKEWPSERKTKERMRWWQQVPYIVLYRRLILYWFYNVWMRNADMLHHKEMGAVDHRRQETGSMLTQWLTQPVCTGLLITSVYGQGGRSCSRYSRLIRTPNTDKLQYMCARRLGGKVGFDLDLERFMRGFVQV